LLAVAIAHAQGADVEGLIERVQRLERQLYLGGGAAPPGQAAGGAVLRGGPIAAQLDTRIGALETALANQTGRVEEVLHRLDRIEDRLDRLVADVDFRLRTLEGDGGALAAAPTAEPTPGPTPATPAAEAGAPPPPAGVGVLGTLTAGELKAAGLTPPPGTAPPAAPPATVPAPPAPAAAAAVQLPPGTAQQRYAFARSLLNQARYDEAEAAFRAFVDAHADDPLAGNALYWLAETYYVRGRYQEAAATYLDGYQRFSDGAKAPDNLLKLGVSLTRLGEATEACAVFDRLAETFPDAPQPIRRRAERERAGIKCP
jgi:tol-pal system protein YbgF